MRVITPALMSMALLACEGKPLVTDPTSYQNYSAAIHFKVAVTICRGEVEKVRWGRAHRQVVFDGCMAEQGWVRR